MKISEVFGAPPYDKTHMCMPDGVGNYTLLIGPDPANNIVISYQAAPLQNAGTDLTGTDTVDCTLWTPVSGPYRNLVEVAPVAPGDPFQDTNSGVPNGDGGVLGRQAGGIGVERRRVHDLDARHRQAGVDGEALDHVVEAGMLAPSQLLGAGRRPDHAGMSGPANLLAIHAASAAIWAAADRAAASARSTSARVWATET